MINCIFIFAQWISLVALMALWLSLNSWNLSSQIRPCCTFIYVTFKSHTEWSNAQYVSISTTMILLITAGTYHSLKLLRSHDIVKLATLVEGDSKAPFSIATTLGCRVGCYSFPWIALFTLDPYLILLNVKQGGIKYHFLSLWYDSTWDWTTVSWAIGKHSNHHVNVWYYKCHKLAHTIKILQNFWLILMKKFNFKDTI